MLVARTAGTVVQGSTPVKLMNVGESEVKLSAGTCIGSFYAAVPNNAKVARVGIYEFVDCDINEGDPPTVKHSKGNGTPPSINLDKPNLTSQQKRGAEELLTEFQDIFSDSKSNLGRTSMTQHNISTGDARTNKQPPRRVPYAMREQLQEQDDEMLDQDIIEPSKSPWSSPVVLVRKKDGSLRFCVDYHRLNAVTCKDAHPLPRVDDCLDALSGSQVFSTLDCASGYWQVEMKRYKQAKIRKRRNQKKIPTPKTEVGKNQTNNQVLIP